MAEQFSSAGERRTFALAAHLAGPSCCKPHTTCREEQSREQQRCAVRGAGMQLFHPGRSAFPPLASPLRCLLTGRPRGELSRSSNPEPINTHSSPELSKGTALFIHRSTADTERVLTQSKKIGWRIRV